MNTLIAACVIVTTSAFASLAGAEEPALTTTVRYGDLNLNRTEGVAVLYQRILQGATRVCAPLEAEGHQVDLVMLSQHRSCVAGAITHAIAQVNWPPLNSYAATRGVPTSIRLAAR
jgi:UrcA family protein